MDHSNELFGIWLGVGIACIGAAISIFGGMPALAIIVLFALVMIGGGFATILVYAEQLMKARAALHAEQAKVKRAPEDRLALLREMLDDDEWASFKATLKAQVLAGDDAAQDGELPLAALVDEADVMQGRSG